MYEEIKIIEMGVDFEIRMTINGIKLYTQRNFDTKEEASEFLKEHGLEESK